MNEILIISNPIYLELFKHLIDMNLHRPIIKPNSQVPTVFLAIIFGQTYHNNEHQNRHQPTPIGRWFLFLS